MVSLMSEAALEEVEGNPIRLQLQLTVQAAAANRLLSATLVEIGTPNQNFN